jgi:hypothetical protein
VIHKVPELRPSDSDSGQNWNWDQGDSPTLRIISRDLLGA